MLHDPDPIVDPMIDPIINDVAREMTTAPATAGLAGRIATRIAAGEATRRRVWARPSVLVPLAAACVLIVAAFVARQRTVEPPRKPAAEMTRAASADAAPDRSVATQSVGRRRRRVAYVAAAARERRQDRRVAPSPALPAIDITPLELDGLAIMPLVQAGHIDLDPIAIARIEIAPMP
jgi:hypothetical protein